MKILHISDLHVGKVVNGYSMLPDQKHFFSQVISLVKERDVEAVCIAGDIYDKSVPTEEAVKTFDEFLVNLSKTGTAVFIISGNHDSEERLNFGSRLLQAQNVFIAAKYNGFVPCHKLHDEFGDVNVYLMPFMKASQVRHYYPDASVNNYDEAIGLVLNNTDVNTDARNIIVAHQFVAGSYDPEMAGSENQSVINVGTIDRVSADHFLKFDYAALGHIHIPQRVKSEHVRYAGSPIKYSLNEIGKDKTIPLITLREKGDVEMEFIPITPLREMRHLRGTISQIMEHAEESEDYMYITLTDETPVLNAMAQLKSRYPNIMKLEYDNNHTRAIGEVNGLNDPIKKTLDEILSDFYKDMYDTDITEDDLSILRETAKEAGL